MHIVGFLLIAYIIYGILSSLFLFAMAALHGDRPSQILLLIIGGIVLWIYYS
jgi:hypothetical protein